jgi:glyoxylase-like metal-dependent hydrolase (beta-lactamase superfamily II)
MPCAWDDLVRARWLVGDYELTVCTDGTYLLDGGAMFGVVPKTLWQKRLPGDEQNRVRLGLNTVVIRTGKHTVLIETGIGNKQTAKMRALQGNQELLPESLDAAGIRADEVDVVINTHLHFDHCGWNTTLRADGSLTPTFTNARYFAHAGEVAHGRLQLERDGVSYLAPNYEELVRSGQMTLVDPHGAGGFRSEDLGVATIQTSDQIVPGIGVECFPGHTAQMMAVHIESRTLGGTAAHACYISDLIPTSHHLDTTWAMAYDLDPLRTISERKRFYERAIPEQWTVLFTHDHEVPVGRVEMNDRGKPVLRLDT